MTSGLVAAYNFAQGSGSVLADVSGNGNNGTISNATWATVNSSSNLPFTGALSFNGTNALVNIPNAASLQLTNGMTLEAWVNPMAVPHGWQDIIYKGNNNYFLESSSSPSNTPEAGATVGTTGTGAFGTAALPTNTWSFLTETFNGSTLNLYVNGVQVASQAISGSLATSTNPLQIGGDSIFGQYFQGQISNVRIYNTALSQSAIQTDMNTPITGELFPNNQLVPPLPAPTGTVINVSTVSQLESAVSNLQSGQTILIAPGTYNLTATLYVPQGLTNIAIRGATGNAGDVVIQGDAVLDPTAPYTGSDIWGTGSGISGAIPFGIWLGNVQGVTIADMTIKDFVDSAINLNAGVQSPLIHNVVMLDTGEQLLKSNPDGTGGGVNNGIVEYCTIGYTTLAPNSYTNGIDLHTTQNWIIRNNLFQNIATTNPLLGTLAGSAILVWNGSKNCTVENNTFINCQEEIHFGLSGPSTITDDNTGGIIKNNFIYRSGTQHGDVAIGVWNSPNTEVAYNTIILNGDYVNAIEYRFSTTTGVNILYNLTDAAITQRDSATATVTGNVTSGVQSSWFVNEAIGNLNLTASATGAIGKGQYLPEVSTDYDGQARPSSGPTDVGAAEYVVAPATPTGLTAIPGNGQVTLNWSASSSATSYNIYRSTTSSGEGSTPYKTGVTGTSFTDSGLTNGTTYYYEISAVNAGGQSPVSSEVSATPEPLVQAISAGGPAAGAFVADTDFSGGYTYSNSDTINTSNVSNPAPQSVYDSLRFGNFAYTIGNLTPGANYTVRLDFAEIYWNAAGDRVFNVAINGSQVLNNFDIYAAAGGKDIAIAPSFSTTANADGQIVIQFTSVVNNAQVNGIEIYNGNIASPATPVGLTATPGNDQVTLNWSASPGAASYNIYRSTTSGGEGSTPYKTGVTATSFTDTGLTNGTPYYYEVRAVNVGGQSPVSSEVSTTPEPLVQAISAGGPAAGAFVADTDFSGGYTYSNSDTINTSNVSNPAPQSVYDSLRFGNFAYTIGNLTPGANYTVRLDFAEIYWNAAGDRVFNVAINGSQVLNNFDIYAAAGGKDIAIAPSFSTTANADGQIVIQFTSVVSDAQVNGIEILNAAPATPTGLTAIANNGQVTLNWSASSSATSYNIYRSTTSGGEGSTPYKTGVTGTSFTDSGLTNGTPYYYQVSAVNAGVQSPVSSEVSATPEPPGTLVLAIDGGGPAAGSYVADTDFSGGTSFSESDAINTSNVSNPAPQAVYDTEHVGKTFSYTIGNLTPSQTYTVRLDFAEIVWTAPGERVFNVAINGSPVLSNFDIFAAAGGKDIAIARTFAATADASGRISIQFTTVVDNAKVSGIQILTAGTAPTVTAVTPVSGATTPASGATTPANGPTSTPPTGSVQVTFSEALDPTTVNSNTVQLLGPSSSVVAATVSYNSSTNTVTLTPTSALANNTTYTVLVHGGDSGAMVTDTIGDPLAADFTYSFTTGGSLTASAGPAESGKEGTAMQFAGSTSGGTGGLSYLWNFGDGSTATGTLTPSHTYLTAGTYTVTLTVTDSANDKSTSTTSATVADVPPTANPGGPYSAAAGTAINFSGSGSVPDPKDTLSYSWNFGDGSTSTVLDPSHTYAAAGTYTVTFTVTASDGVHTTATTTATVGTILSVLPVTTPYITTPYLSIPNFGATPTIFSVKSGNWSDPTIWSLGRTPQAGDIVDINPGTTVTYNLNDSTDSIPLNTVEVQPTATLTFSTAANTQMFVGTLMVLQGGTLDIGTSTNPIPSNVTANVVWINQPLDVSSTQQLTLNDGTATLNTVSPLTASTVLDPQQYGNGLIALGNVTTYGAAKAPYVTLAQEAHTGDTTLQLATPATGWQVGDKLQLPDTEELPYLWTASNTNPQWETVTIQSISTNGLTVTLTAPLQYDHLGATNSKGVLEYLPQVVDTTRNVNFHSQSATGTRGYALFTDHADVNINYTGFGGMGRTSNVDEGNLPYAMLPFDNTTFDSSGNVTHMGTNEENRNPVTFLDLIGPSTPQSDGYQFTFVGNTVMCPLSPMPYIWGVNVVNSSYGLIQSNDVVNWYGAGINVDATSTYNMVNGNFVMRISGDAVRADQDFQGDAYWFGNTINYITNNIATDINGYSQGLFSYGYDIDATTAKATIPLAQGDDPSLSGQSQQINVQDTPILEFAGNEVYGATVSGMTIWDIGETNDTPYANAQTSVIKNLVVWNVSNRGFYGYPSSNITIDGMVVLNDASLLSNGNNCTLGITFDDYLTNDLVIENCDIEGTGCGIKAPYFLGPTGASNCTAVIENSYLDNAINIDIVPPHSDDTSNLAPETFDIISVAFAQSLNGWANINMDYGGTGGPEMSVPQYVYVTNYNDIAGDDFQVYYSQSPAPTGTPPSNATTMQYINGLVS